MNSKIFFFLVMATSFYLFSKEVSKENALKVANNWIKINGKSKVIPEFKKAESINYQNELCLYYLKNNQGNFVLVSADDTSIPILAYSMKTRKT